MLIFLQEGFSFFLIGLLMACRDLTVNVLEIPSGAIADSFGRRGAMIVSFVAYIISFLVLASANSVWPFFVGMILYGIGDTFRTGTHKAMIFEWLRINGRGGERTRIYGITRSWSQIGSALSALIAAAFVLINGTYEYVFYFATVPYILNLINLGTYPPELDGDHGKATSIKESIQRLKKSLRKSVSDRALRRLTLESMGWGGFFAAIKDYLQPVLEIAAVLWITNLFLAFSDAGAENLQPFFNESQKAALIIGPIYALLFFLSAWASRNASRFVEHAQTEDAAAAKLWRWNLLAFAGLLIAGWFQWRLVVIISFIGLYVLRNLWRPILITRFDSHSDAGEGATILSIESQAQRLSTFVLAPVIGLLVDFVTRKELGEPFWPIGAIGVVICLAFVLSGNNWNRRGDV